MPFNHTTASPSRFKKLSTPLTYGVFLYVMMYEWHILKDIIFWFILFPKNLPKFYWLVIRYVSRSILKTKQNHFGMLLTPQ